MALHVNLGVCAALVVTCEIWGSAKLQFADFLSTLEDTPFLRDFVVAEDGKSVIRRQKNFSGTWLSSCW